MVAELPTIARIDAATLPAQREALVDLLVDAIENGSSVGFVLPRLRDDARRYWDGLATSLTDGSRLLWLASDATGPLGTVQLELATRRNGVNRAEVQKLLVHTRARRKGIGRKRMQAIEARARELRRGLLYLDTEAGSDAEQFNKALDYTCIGGLPEYACSPRGEWRANAIDYKTLFLRGGSG